MKKSDERLGVLQRLTLMFFGRAKTTISLWLAVAVFGVMSYTVWLQRQGFPDVAVPFGVVNAQYFVDDAARVDSEVAEVVNKAILGVEGVKAVHSNATDNFATFAIEYHDSLTSEGGNERVRSAIESTALPSSVQFSYRAINATKFNDKFDIVLSVSDTESASAEELEKLSQQYTQSLQDIRPSSVEGVEVISPFRDGVDPVSGKPVRLQTSFDRLVTRENGQTVATSSVLLGVRGVEGADSLLLSDEVRGMISDRAVYPTESFRVDVSGDFAEGIRSQVSTLQGSLLEGLLIVVVVGFILISWRAGIVTAFAMLTTLLITVGALFAFGMTLNTITLFGLILCLGLIVDDAIIMVEALDAARKSKESKKKIAANVTKKVGLASLSGTLTTMLGFAPLLFVGGILGEFIRALPITIITSLAASLVVSITLVPFIAKYLMLGKNYSESGNPIHNLEKNISRALGRRIRKSSTNLRNRVTYTAFALLISVSSLGLAGSYFGKLKFDIFPSTKDANSLSVTVNIDAPTTIAAAEEITREVEQVIVETLGENLIRASLANSGSERSAQYSIDLVGFEDRDETSVMLVQKLNEALKDVPGAQYRVAQIDAGPPRDDYPFKVQIYGDQGAAAAAAQAMYETLADMRVERPNGTEAQVVRRQRSDPEVRTRVDNKPYQQVSAGFDASDTSALVLATQEALERVYTEEKLASYGVSIGDVAYDFGSESENQESFSGVLIAFPILLVVMYVLLVAQFRSFTQPILIFTAIPFSLLGVGYGLYVTDNPLSFFVMVALFALIGVAVNNTILLTDYANQARRLGKSRTEAVAMAVEQRFRPLVTTSLTSVIALIPLAIADPFWESLAVTLIFGLLSSTLLVVVVYPYYYLINEWIIIRLKSLARRVVKTKRA